LILSRLVNRLMDVTGIYNVQVNLPSTDRLVGVDTFIQIGDVNVVHRIKGRSYQDPNIPGGTTGNEQTTGLQIPGVSQTNFGLQQGIGE